MVAFGNLNEGSDGYALLQLSSEFDQQDHDLGLDGVYSDINDQSHGG